LPYEILLQHASIVSCLCVFGISHFGLYYLYSSTTDDPKEKILVKAGMVVIAITEGLLLFSDILGYRKNRIEEKLEK